MKRFLRDNGLGLAFGVLFLGTLVAQAFVGHADFNQHQLAHHGDPISLWRYVTSSSFGIDVLENWQSEYLQFTLYIVGTVWLLQRGSPESKKLGEAGGGTDEEQRVGEHAAPDSPKWARAGGWRTRIYSNSLLIAMGGVFLLSLLGQAVTGRVAYNADRFDHQQVAIGCLEYVMSPDFLEPDAAELVVGVPGDRLHGRALGLPAPARLAGVQAGGSAALRHGHRGLDGRATGALRPAGPAPWRGHRLRHRGHVTRPAGRAALRRGHHGAAA